MSKGVIKRLFFSEFILNANTTRKITYVGVMTALSVVGNMLFEFKMLDVQFSLTILLSVLIGVLLGSVFGFVSCVVGDLIGFFINSGGTVFMPWVGLSTGALAFIAGIIVCGINWKFKGELFIKLLIVCILSFFICTVAINSTGFYFYNRAMGFSDAVLNYVAKTFGSGVDYWAYLAYRLIFKGQIYNNLFNYALVFVLIPLVLRLEFFNPKRKNSD